jgi:hypothetical protein
MQPRRQGDQCPYESFGFGFGVRFGGRVPQMFHERIGIYPAKWIDLRLAFAFPTPLAGTLSACIACLPGEPCGRQAYSTQRGRAAGALGQPFQACEEVLGLQFSFLRGFVFQLVLMY